MFRGSDPPALDDRLDALAARVRRMRILRGGSCAALVAVCAALAIAVLDSNLNLSVASRCILEAAWFLLVGGIAWRFAVRPWLADPPMDEVAERMMADDAPNVIAALAREEKEHRVFPVRPVFALAVIAATGFLAAIAMAANAGERVRRIALPWHTRAAIAPFEIIVVSGDAVARRGEQVTLSAYLKPNDANAILPDMATLAIRDGKSLPMTGANGAFHATIPGTDADFEYRIEAGDRVSDWHTVRLADAVELAAGTRIVVSPPKYAEPLIKSAASEFVDIDALQHSTANFQLKFNRAAESAVIEWRPDGRNPFEAADAFVVSLAADRLSGTAALPLRSNGMLRVILVNEAGVRRIRTETAISVRVRPDAPPEVERIEGMAAQSRSLRPGQPLRIAFAARAGFGTPSAVIEYATSTASGTAPVLIEVGGPSRIEGRSVVDVPVLAKDGETIRVRLRIRDSRRIPELNLGPQEATFPPDGWFEVKVSSSAAPFDEQQIIGQCDGLNSLLATAKEKIATAKADAESLQRDTAPSMPLAVDHALRFAALRESLREVRLALERGAADARLTVQLAGLAGHLGAFADGLVRETDEMLQQAAVDNARARATFLKSSLKHLDDALAETDRLAASNNRLAQNRLDRSRLNALWQEQRSVVAMLESGLSPEELAARERTALAELKRIVAQSEPLTREANRVVASESARLAAEARKLAGRIRDLDVAAVNLNTSLRRALLVELVADQSELAKRAAELAKQLELPARLANAMRPKREDFDHVTGLLERDKIVDALTESERLANSLEKLAETFESWTADRADAKLAAGQFATWQSDLRTRWLADPKVPAVAEQQAILASVEKLRVPPGDAATVRDTAIVHLRLAARRLEIGAADPDMAMKFAAESLERLATKLQTLPVRLKQARIDVEKLRLEQNALIETVERTLRPFERSNLTPAVMQNIAARLGTEQTKQSKLADRLSALDIPTHEPRQATVVLALKAAASDLKDGLPYDAIASLGAARRELDRLKLALEGQVPADVRAVELASKQAEALSLVLAAGESAGSKHWQPVVSLQLEVKNGITTGEFAAPEAPGLLADARTAAELAEFSLRDGSKFEVIVRRMRDSKDALNLLADRLNDRESERDRIKRLAAFRKSAECAAKKLAGRPANPAASAVAKVELDHELTELAMTRVGAVAQSARRKAFDLYLRLQNRPEPDRQAADQRQLAEVLAEVASHMANEARLTTRPEAAIPSADPAEDYLPARKHAAALRDAAHRERELREKLKAVSTVVAERLKPAASNPFAALETRQRAMAAAIHKPRDLSFWRAVFIHQFTDAAERAAERLAVGDLVGATTAARACSRYLNRLGVPEVSEAQSALAAELEKLAPSSNAVAAQQQARHAVLASQARDLAQLFTEAEGVPAAAESAEHLRAAERALSDAGRKGQSGAAAHRAEAHQAVLAAAPVTPAVAQDGADPAALAVRDAERALVRAIRELGPKGDHKAAAEAIRRAERALQDAAGAIR